MARSAHSMAIIPSASMYSSNPSDRASSVLFRRYRSMWQSDRFPLYSLISVNVGLVTGTFMPRVRAIPCTKQVLPLPISPCSAMIIARVAGGRALISLRATFRVSSGLRDICNNSFIVNIRRVIGECFLLFLSYEVLVACFFQREHVVALVFTLNDSFLTGDDADLSARQFESIPP